MKSMQQLIDVHQNLMERLMQGPIHDNIRTEYVEQINELGKPCVDATVMLEALSPKAPPAIQASYCVVYSYADVA